MIKKSKFLLLVLLAASAGARAQSDVSMADGLRAEGKIYVVVAIMLIILAGLLTFLFLMDRKVTRLEQRQRKSNPGNPG